jgi:serine-type D-Ala-D-Ala carboxypeptidase
MKQRPTRKELAGHAGLFSTAEVLARYAMAMLKLSEFPLGPATVREMTRPREIGGVRRCLGWDSRSRYSINRPDLMTPAAFGHSGFTGTSMWIDPELDLFVIFLSTRLHPDGVGSVNDLAGRIGNIAAGAVWELP